MGHGAAQSGVLAHWHRKVYCALFNRQLARLPRSMVDGVELFFPAPEAERVQAALALMRTVDARRYRRLTRHLSRLTHSRVGTHYDVTADAGCIDVALEGGTWRLAAALVHEATHAWLFKARGLSYEGPCRARHERLCLREERYFLTRVVRHAGWTPVAEAAWLERLQEEHRAALACAWWEDSWSEQVRAARWHRQLARVAS
jgi:DNA-binding transcriptional ArsR family regulator